MEKFCGFVENLALKRAVLLQLLQQHREDRGFSIFVPLEHPSIEVDDEGFGIVWVRGRQVALQKLKNAGFSTAPIAKESHSDGQHGWISDDGSDEIRVNLKSKQVLVSFVVRPHGVID